MLLPLFSSLHNASILPNPSIFDTARRPTHHTHLLSNKYFQGPNQLHRSRVQSKTDLNFGMKKFGRGQAITCSASSMTTNKSTLKKTSSKPFAMSKPVRYGFVGIIKIFNGVLQRAIGLWFYDILEYAIAFIALKREKHCATISFAMTLDWENKDFILVIEQAIDHEWHVYWNKDKMCTLCQMLDVHVWI